jgi:hypothetical protein
MFVEMVEGLHQMEQLKPKSHFDALDTGHGNLRTRATSVVYERGF